MADRRPDSLNRIYNPDFDMQFMVPVIDSSFAELCFVYFTGYVSGIYSRKSNNEKKQYFIHVMNLANHFVVCCGDGLLLEEEQKVRPRMTSKASSSTC